MQPFFSIIIPTRNRYSTLRSAVLSVANQSFKDFELIISDNSDPGSHFDTDEIERSFPELNFRYIKPDVVLSMSDHWEFALLKARGRYIILFGDDDALIKEALGKIFSIIKETGKPVISWARVEYNWPDREPANLANLFIIPVNAFTGIVNSKVYIKRVINNKADYRFLPMLYNSAISADLVEKLRSEAGRVFNASSPDIFTGYAFAHIAKQYVTVGYPLSVNGVSGKSNGAAHANQNKSIQSDFWKLFNKSNIQWPRHLAKVITSYSGILEPFLQLSETYPELKRYISRKRFNKLMIDTLEASSQEDMDQKIARIMATAEDDRGLRRWIAAYLAEKNPVFSPPAKKSKNALPGFDGSNLVVDAAKFGIKSVYDVSVFVGDLWGEIKQTPYMAPVEKNVYARLRRAVGVILKGR